jgi:hypothetical protein
MSSVTSCFRTFGQSLVEIIEPPRVIITPFRACDGLSKAIPRAELVSKLWVVVIAVASLVIPSRLLACSLCPEEAQLAERARRERLSVGVDIPSIRRHRLELREQLKRNFHRRVCHGLGQRSGCCVADIVEPTGRMIDRVLPGTRNASFELG